jgi:beta-glucanase (GH16 family)
MRMTNILIYLMVLFVSACSKKSTTGSVYTPQVPVDKNWTFESTPVWADEFDNAGSPNTAKWGYDLGGGGWGNHELQNYTNTLENAKVEGGNLVITAKKESSGGMNYTSARLISKNKGDFLYGRIEVSAKLPAGRGTWPAIWMLPTDWEYGSWPKSGELDIMEHVGYDLNKVYFTVHTDAYNHSIGTEKGGNQVVPNATTAFHKYRADWTPYAIRGYFDDQLVYTFVNEGKGSAYWPFDKRFHVLLNLAIGGDWGGAQGVDDTAFPQQMFIDYIRVYKMIE